MKKVRRCAAVAAVLFVLVLQSIPDEGRAQQTNTGNGGAPRDPWRITYSIGGDETWSDNINLGSAGTERSDFVTTISPSLSVTRLSPTLTANFFYQPQFLYYAHGTNGNGLRNALSANAKANVIENLLTFDALASISQQNISPFGTQAANTVNGSSNRAETRTYSLGPTLSSRYNQDLSYSAGYHFLQSSSDSSAYATSRTSDVFAQAESSTSFRNVGFGGNYNRTEQDYGGINRIITESIGSRITYVFGPTIHLFANIGYDRNRYPTTGQPDLKGLSYSGGFDWEPTRHTSLNALVGHRYFGPTANIVLRETTSKVALSAVYSRDQSTSTGSGLTSIVDPNYALVDQLLLTEFPDPVARAQAVAATLTRLGLPASQTGSASFLSNQLILQKRAEVSVALLGLRNTVTLDVFRTDSQSLSAITAGLDVFNQASKIRSTSYTANWSHKLGPKTSANVSLQKVRNEAVAGNGQTSQRLFTLSLNRQIQPRLNGSLFYRNVTQTSESSSSGFFGGNYRENAVLGSLRLTF